MRKEQLVEELSTLPRAELKPIFYETPNGAKVETNRRAVVNVDNDHLYDIVSDGYVLINHDEAFTRIIDSLNIPAGTDLNARVHSYEGMAFMNLLFDQYKIEDGKQGVQMGVQVVNSYDRSRALGLQLQRRTFDRTEKTIVFYGMRKVCSNGMKIKVPLSQMTPKEIDKLNPEKDVIAKEEYRDEKEHFGGRIVHYGKAAFEYKFKDLEDMVFRASNYVQLAIDKAMAENLTNKQVEVVLTELRLPKKIIKDMVAEFETKDRTMWEAYNLVTAHATHETKNPVRKDELLDLAWDKLIVPAVKAK